MIEPQYAIRDKRNIEESAQKQIENCLKLDDVVKMAIFPDIHTGKGYPIGVAIATRNIIYPYVTGNDIGCGMSLFETDLLSHKFKRDKMDRSIKPIEEPLSEEECSEIQNKLGIKIDYFKSALGTIGSGNHFSEFMQIEEIFNSDFLNKVVINPKAIFLLVHTGSRGLGEMTLRKYVDKYKSAGVDVQSEEGKAYLKEHDQAVSWALANRLIVAERFSQMTKMEMKIIFDSVHNRIRQKEIDGELLWVHHKGAIDIESEFVIIPGSRGDYSYLVKVHKKPEFLYSLAHGAGRKFQRGIMKHRLSEKYSTDDLKITKFGSLVICEDKDLLYEEAPEAYKKIDMVIDELKHFELITPVAKFRPVLTYKTR